MTPLQKVAMGLVIVLVDAMFSGYDGVPDPLGWALVLAGLLPLRALAGWSTLLVTAVACLVVSLATYPPQVAELVDDTGGWALSLPQLAFGYLLCATLAPHAGPVERRFNVVRWLFVVLAAAPVVVLGGEVEVLRNPLAFASAAVHVYLIYLLFLSSSRIGRDPDNAAEPEAEPQEG